MYKVEYKQMGSTAQTSLHFQTMIVAPSQSMDIHPSPPLCLSIPEHQSYPDCPGQSMDVIVDRQYVAFVVFWECNTLTTL